MTILYFVPYNQQVVYIESIAEQESKRGHKIILATYDSDGPIHTNFKKFGSQTLSLKKPLIRLPFLYHFFRIFQLTRLCSKLNVNLVYSHYQEANLVSSIAQFFCKSTFILTRHHSDCAYVDNNVKEKIGDKIINRLAKYYIAPSNLVYHQIVEVEKTNPKKVYKIDYGYNFDNFQKPDLKVVAEIKSEYSAQLLLIEAARFIPEKRHKLLLEVISTLINEGLGIKLLLLGKGDLESELRQMVANKHLEERIIFLGYKHDISNYFAAADLMVHLSVSEASNSAVKEAAITGTPAAVCSDVGDFSDYIKHKKNGILLPRDHPESDLINHLKYYYERKDELRTMGQHLNEEVVKRFNISTVFSNY
jgi:glycosyltransferase involved in cell wall biosynthesis